MIFLKFIRILITIVLVVALLISGGVILFNYSVSRVVLDEDYFGKHLLESGTYDDIFEALIDDLAGDELIPNTNGDASDIFISGLSKEMPDMFSEVAAEYLSDWMAYIKGDRDIDEVPILDIKDSMDALYDYAVDLTMDEEFMTAMLAEYLKSIGDDIDNYNQNDYKEMIADLQLKEDFTAVIDEMMNDAETQKMINSYTDDPLAFFRNENTSDQEMMERIYQSHGVIKSYNYIATLVYGAALLAIVLLFVMWINKINVPLIINGIVFVLSSVPLLLFSLSEALFNGILRFIIQSILEQNIRINIYMLPAIRPIITSMSTVSAAVFALGIVMFIAGIIIGKNKTAEGYNPPAETLY